MEASVTNSFSGSPLSQFHTSGFESQDAGIVLLKILPVTPVWAMVGVLTNFQHALCHLSCFLSLLMPVVCIIHCITNNSYLVSCENLSLLLTCLVLIGGWLGGSAELCWTFMSGDAWLSADLDCLAG